MALDEREEIFSYISDAFKGIHGFRPRHIDWRKESVDTLEAIADGLHREIAKENNREEDTIALFMSYGAPDRETALRWMKCR